MTVSISKEAMASKIVRHCTDTVQVSTDDDILARFGFPRVDRLTLTASKEGFPLRTCREKYY